MIHKEDITVGWLKSKLSTVKKYGVLGLAAVTFPLWQPYVGDYIGSYFDQKAYEQTYKAITDYHKAEHYISDGVLIRIIKKVVLVQSIDKVRYIERRLKECSRITSCEKITDWQRGRVEKDVLNELKRQSNEYVTLLNMLPEHKRIGRIGDYIAKTFPMEGPTELMEGYNFMKDVNEIMFMEGVGVSEKGDAIMAYMIEIQSDYFELVYKKMLGQ